MNYRGYELRLDSNSQYLLYDKRGQFVQEFVSDREVFEYIDSLSDCNVHEESYTKNVTIKSSKIQEYYVYRILRHAVDTYNNYQYFSGTSFRFGASNAQRVSCDYAQYLLNKYHWDTSHVYHMVAA